MLRARDAMDRYYWRPLDVAALARIAYVSEAHFIRTFRATFGETPHRYLQRRRVERAMFMLRESDRTVTEICFDVGFMQPRHLQPHVPRHRRLLTIGVPRRRRGGRCTDMLRNGMDATEQFWRSQRARAHLA